MKFKEFLQDHQIPEWAASYVDYKGIKNHVKCVAQYLFPTLTDGTFDEKKIKAVEAPALLSPL
ncbi:hypothetical protein KIPB_015492, partial [Kipferlia bialata]|eukprot:g15492.t1